MKFDFSTITTRQLIQTGVVLNSCSLVPSRLHETHVSRTKSVSEDRLIVRYSLEQVMSTILYTMTFSHPWVFLPTFREQLEFDFAFDTLEQPDKSYAGLILSCSDDSFYLRTLYPSFRSYSYLHPYGHRYFSKPPFFKL